MKRGATEQAKQLKNKAPALVVEQYEKQYDHSMAAFPKVSHDLAYQTSLLYIRETEANTSEPISCRAGCGFCCHQPVFTSFAEFEGIKDHLIAKGRKMDINKLKLQHSDIDDGVYNKLKVTDRRCLFLGDNNCCTIYEVRPIMCRRHHVYSEPEHCASGSKSEMRFDVSPRTEGHLSAYFTYYEGDHLQGHLLADADLVE